MTFQFQGPFSSSSSSSSSSNSIITHRCAYDVFLSSRGKDTRYNFSSDLYNALHKKGINTTFINGDDDELKTKREEEISQTLVKSIEGSRTSVVVLSRNYASSTWCLDQLVKILECKQTKGQVVLPVFWKVDPSDVRHQRKSFGKALAQLEDNTKMQSWKTALKYVANLSGWHIARGKGNESEFIQEIVQTVSIIVNCTYLNVANHPVGIESRVQDINLLLSIGRNDTRMVGIFGVGGIGKTTIAKAIYNLIAHQFEGSCFLSNVRESSKQEVGLVQLQETLLFKILRDARSSKVGNVDRGINVIKHRLCSKRVLLILDDVDHLFQLEALAGKCDWFGLGSRIIITTRDKSLLTNHEINFTYEVKGMDHNEALELFSWNAFKKNKPIDEYVELTECAIHYAGGLPLALLVLGSDLYGKSKIQWKSALDKYERVPNKNIQEILKISYEGLDKTEQDIFLDIACFFKGRDLDDVMSILDSCSLYPDSGIARLFEKCLVTVDQGNILSMHDLLQQMGMEIVRQESPQVPRKRSRLWCYEDALEVLSKNRGSNKIRGIVLRSSKPITVQLEAKAFKQMKNLKFLIVDDVRTCGQLTYLPNGLRLLDWPSYSFALPSTFCPKKLVQLNMPHSHITLETLIKQGIQFANLKVINLSECDSIIKLPDLCAPNLEILNLYRCKNLVEVDESIGYLDNLQNWELTDCENLRILPSSFMLKSLHIFRLEGCSRLEKFPDIQPEMNCLSVLELRQSGIRDLPSSIGYLTMLQYLNLYDCQNLKELPDTIYKLRLLDELSICTTKLIPTHDPFDSFSEYGFMRLKHLYLNDGGNPIELDFLSKPNYFPVLKFLDLNGTNISTIPERISKFTRLEGLRIDNCKQLQEIPSLPRSISKVFATNCLSLNPQSLSRLLTKFEESYYQEYEILQSPGLSFPKYELILPGTEIPKLFNHQSFGNSISFWVGQDFPAILLCIVFGLEEQIGNGFVPTFHLRLIIKCREKTVDILANVIDGESEPDHLWVAFVPYGEFHETFDDLNLYDQNEVEIVFKTLSAYDPPKITPTIKRCGVHTKCICPQKFGESNMHHKCHSANPLQPLLPLFPSSTKITNHGIDSGLRGLYGDDSDVRECQPPLVPDDTRRLLFPSTVGLPLGMMNGSDLGLGRLVFESTICDGCDLGSSSMAHTVSNESDLNSHPPLKKMSTS